MSGRVQGVGFRAWLVRRAGELGLCGWACNRADGRVELEVEGSADALKRLASLLAEGPRLARVERVDELPPSSMALPTGFEIVAGSRHD